MNDKPIIVVGLVVALAVLTVPFWYALARGSGEPAPDMEQLKPEGYQRCVRDAEYMKAHHMELLNQWRDEVVRDNDRSPVEIDGHDYPKSLTRGCLSCHVSRDNFCKKCHEYANVEPACWHCHVESIGN